MKFPVEVCFIEMDHSTALTREIVAQIKKVDAAFEHIERCRVTIETIAAEAEEEVRYRINILLSVANHRFKFDSASGDQCTHEDPFVAVRCAFEAIRQKLRSYLSEIGIDSDQHQRMPHGRITRLCLSEGGADRPDRGSGIISTCDGRQVYFHARNLEGIDFQRLELGSEVDFVEECDEKGSRATSVHLIPQQLKFDSV